MQIRFIRAEDAPNCNHFYNRLYKETRSIEQWRWSFMSRFLKDGQIPFVVAMENDRIVGTQALMPIPMIDEKGISWAAKSEETLLDPAFRGKGVFEEMYRPLLEYMRLHEFSCIWGFSAASKAFRKIGFSTPGITSQIFLPFSPRAVDSLVKGQPRAGTASKKESGKVALYRALCGVAKCLSAVKNWRAREGRERMSGKGDVVLRTLNRPPTGAAHVMEKFVERWGGQTIYRDNDYLQWRIFDNPYRRAVFRAAYGDGQLVGWIAYTIGDEDMGFVVDIIASAEREEEDRKIVELLLDDAVNALRGSGATGIRAWRINNHPFDEMLTTVAKRLGFYRVNKGYSAVLYGNKDSDRIHSVMNFDKWFITRIYTEGRLG